MRTLMLLVTPPGTSRGGRQVGADRGARAGAGVDGDDNDDGAGRSACDVCKVKITRAVGSSGRALGLVREPASWATCNERGRGLSA